MVKKKKKKPSRTELERYIQMASSGTGKTFMEGVLGLGGTYKNPGHVPGAGLPHPAS